ncbi:hypothetical protein [Aeropyrum camini]|uniref:hypothetical protein n=1 Tax=Aeropyrum camini TaxID=229980 RepID=UPI001C4348B2|nr:hypothetical protein [Aeropyrum camini]
MSRVRKAGFIELEGLAINGLLRSARLEECDNPRGGIGWLLRVWTARSWKRPVQRQMRPGGS